MFVNAIEEVGLFTRPIHIISRNFKETVVNPGTASLFFVNDEGCAVTCRHVVDLIGNRDPINLQYENFKKEKKSIGKNKFNQRIKELETRYNYKDATLIQIKDFFGGVSSDLSIRYNWINHPIYDLSIVRIENLKNSLYQSHACFLRDSSILKQGKFMCRLGYPFPEFTNFRYDPVADDIEWTNAGQIETPRFPIEGMLTRHLMHEGKMIGLELSTPGLKGQSGGPLFDENGIICGMQSGTNHLHLGFDMKNFEYKLGGHNIRINNQPFLHVGHCVHVDVIKTFLRENNIKFFEA